MTVHDTDLFIGIAQQALWVTALVAAPVLLAALAIGAIVGVVQAATSINEATLSFVPKLIAIAIILALLGGAMMTLIADFTRDLFALIPELVT